MRDNTPITVEITKLLGDPIKTADVKPHSKNISNIVDGNKVIFTITKPALLAVEIDGYPNAGTKISNENAKDFNFIFINADDVVFK